MNETEARRFAICKGIKGGLVASQILCLILIGIPWVFMVLVGLGSIRSGESDFRIAEACSALAILLGSLAVSAIVGVLFGGAIGLLVHYIVRCPRHASILSAACGLLLGSAAGGLVQLVLFAVLLNSSPSDLQEYALIAYLMAGLAGMAVSREIVREHP